MFDQMSSCLSVLVNSDVLVIILLLLLLINELVSDRKINGIVDHYVWSWHGRNSIADFCC